MSVDLKDPSIATDFRAAMGQVCTPVAVVTAFDGQRPHGTTVSAFMSLSMAPPLVAVALDNDSELLELVRRTGRFAVNVLSDEQPHLALAFAKKGPDKFDGMDWSTNGGLPQLAGTSVWLRCETASLTAGGDHTIISGAVMDVTHCNRPPLTYHRRTFGTHDAALGGSTQ